MKLRKEKIYSHYVIITIMFYWSAITFLPLVLVFSYLFSVDQVIDSRVYILIILAVNIFLTILGGLLIFFQRKKLRRKVKAHYRVEYIYLLFISAFAILGMVVLFDYLGGNRDYIANILVFVLAIVFTLLILIGNKFFKFNYIKKK